MKKTLVIFSGGQDSTTCLGWAKKNSEEVHAITFSYGQKHNIEVQQAEKICELNNVRWHHVDISFFGNMVKSALTHNGDVNEIHEQNEKLPASFVPNRNALFITLAHAFAQTIEADAIVTGVTQSDYSGYPDCRDTFIDSIQHTLHLASEKRIPILTPLMYLNKAKIFRLALEVDILDDVILHSHTCYNGNRSELHDWGFGCGECPACKLRAQGYYEFQKILKDDKKHD